MPRRRQLKGFAYNIVQKFCISDDHFYELARRHRTTFLEIDLLETVFYPPLFDVPRNRTLVGYCQNSLRRIMDKYPFDLQSATLHVHYPPSFREKDRSSASSCRCVLVDDCGRAWKGES